MSQPVDAFPTLEQIETAKTRQGLVAETALPYERAAYVVNRQHTIKHQRSAGYAISWFGPQSFTEEVKGKGPKHGRPIRKAIMGLVEADEANMLTPPLSDDLRVILGGMKAAIDNKITEELEGVEEIKRERVADWVLEKVVDKSWFEYDGFRRDEAMMALEMAVNHRAIASSTILQEI